MPSFLDKLPRPFFVLAPMDDVTDTVFRQIIADCAPPNLFFTEFVNVDGLQSPGREKLLQKLIIGPNEGRGQVLHADGVQGDNEKRTNRIDNTESESRKASTQQSAASDSRVASSASQQSGTVQKSVPLVAQLWGKNPENYYKTVKELKKIGFAGVDLNFGCPDKAVIKNGCCIALADNRELAGEIIDAVKKAAGNDFPVSVKTRLGNRYIDLSWHEFLLSKKLNMLTIHGRTAKEMSKVPVHWDEINEIRKLRDKLSPATLIVGNGDVLTRAQGEELASKYRLDGIMIGRGVFHDPFVFAKESPWASYTQQQKIDLYTKHVKLFAKTRPDAERKIATLGKFCKIYINDFPGAKEFREELMQAKSTKELLDLLVASRRY